MNRPTEGCTYCGSNEHTTTACPMRGEHPLKGAAEFIEAFTDKAMTAHRNGEHRKFTGISTAGASPTDRDIIGEVIEEDKALATPSRIAPLSTEQSSEYAEARRTAEYWKAEHIAENAIIAQRDARIEEQAREIERLRSYESEWEHILNEQREELAALKAQSGRVVLPERKSEDASFWQSPKRLAIALKEVARLNSSSVTCHTCKDSSVVSTTDKDHNGEHIEQRCPDCAGGVDEPMKRGDEVRRLREALEIYAATYNDHWKPGMPILEPISDSALNAGSAVPDGVDDRVRQLIAEKEEQFKNASRGGFTRISLRHDIEMLESLLAAAPTAKKEG